MALTLRTGGGLLSPASAVNSNKNTSVNNNGGLIGGVGYLAEKSALGFLSSVEGIWDYSAGGVAKLFGVDKWAERQFANDWVNYTHADEWYDPGKGWQIAGDVAGGIGTSMPAIAGAAGAALITYFSGGTAAPAAAKLLSASVAPLIAGFGAAGSATKEAYQKTGNLGAKEFGYGALSGATEAAIEGVTAGIGTGTGRIVSAISKKAAGETVQTLSKSGAKSVIKHLAADFASEAVEEGLAEAIDPLYQKLTIDPNAKAATAQEIGYAALVGGLSGLVMSGGAATVNTIANLSSGNAAINSGNAEKIIKTASSISAYEDANDTGYESYKAISADYKALSESLKQTGGQITTAKQRMLLGSLKKAETAAFVEPFIERSAENLLLHADSAAERFSAFGMTDADGKEIHVTADEIRSGVDADLIRKADSGKLTEAEQKTFTKQVRAAMRSNSVLTTLATMDATGRITMDARKFAEAAREGADIATAADINAFAETASQEEIRDLAADLGIADWAALTPDEFREKTAAFAQSDRGRELSYQSRRIRAAMGLAEDSAVELPKAFRGDIAEGATRYRTADGIDMAIIREGDRNYIYNYASGNISRAMSEADVNKILADYWSGNKKAADDARLALSQNKAHNNAEKVHNNTVKVQNNAELLGVAATARYNMLAAENIKGWRQLSEPVKQAVRMTMRQAEAAGLSEDTAITFGRVAAHSGMNIVFDSIRSGAGDALQTGNTIYIDPGADKSRIEKRLLIHEMAHALIKGANGWTLLQDAFRSADPTKAQKISKQYISYYKQLGMDAAQYMPIVNEEIAVSHLEDLLGSDGVWDYMLADEPSLGEKVLNFFRGSARDYADDAGLSAESRKLLTMYRKMFRELSERNRGNNAVDMAREDAGVTGESRYAFAGEKAKTADKMKLDTAKQMIRDGKDSETVRKETGWFRGMDGKWRFELNDIDFKLSTSGGASRNPDIRRYDELVKKVYFEDTATEQEQEELRVLSKNLEGVKITPTKLGDLIDHPDLFAAYPQLEDIEIYFSPNAKSGSGSYHPGFKEIAMAQTDKLNQRKLREVLIHEIQHAIQDIEGFAGGSNPDQFAATDKRSAYEQYRNTAGEVEARDATSRGNMTTEQRKNTRPDIDREDVVFADNSNVSLNLDESLGDQLQEWLENGGKKGEKYNGVYFDLGTTPDVLVKHGAKKVKMIMYDDVVAKVTGMKGDEAHVISLDEISKLPSQLNDPILLFKGSVDNSFVALTELTDKRGNDVIVAVHINRKDNRSTITKIASLYSKTNQYGKNKIIDYVNAQLNAGNLIDASNKKAPMWFTTRGLQLPKVVQTIIDANSRIAQNQPKVNRNAKISSKDRLALPEEGKKKKKYHMSHGQLRADVANKTRKKAYSKADARETLRDVLGYDRLPKQTQDELATLLWQGFNTNETQEQRESFARSFSMKLAEEVFRVEISNENADMYRERAKQLGAGIGRIVLAGTEYADRLKKLVGEKKYKSFVSTWAFKQNKSEKRAIPLSQYVNEISEIPGMDQLKRMDLTEALVEIDRMYRAALENSFEVKGLYDDLDYAGKEKAARGIENGILQAFDQRGTQSKFSKDVDRALTKVAEKADAHVQKIRKDTDAAIQNVAKKADRELRRMQRELDEANEKYREAVGDDKVVISKGTAAKQKAEYKSDRVYNRVDISRAFESVSAYRNIPEEVRRKFEAEVWEGLNTRTEQAAREMYLADEVSNKLFQTILNEALTDEKMREWNDIEAQKRKVKKDLTGSERKAKLKELNELQDAILDDHSARLADSLDQMEINRILDEAAKAFPKILKAGRTSKRAAMETEFNMSDAGYWKQQYKDVIERNKVLNKIHEKAQKMKNLKMGTFLNATQMDNDVFKYSIEALANIEYRGNLSVGLVKGTIKDLQNWYQPSNRMLKYFDEENHGYFDRGILEKMQELTETGDVFTVQQLNTLLEVMSYFTNFVEKYGKIWRRGIWIDAEPMAYIYVKQIRKNESLPKTLLDRRFTAKYLEQFGDPASVVRYHDKYQMGFYTDTYNELRAAALEADTMRMDVLRDYDKFMQEHPKYMREAAKQTVKWAEQQFEARMPKMVAIGLYMTSKRYQAQAGLAFNGFEFEDADGQIRRGGGVLKNVDNPKKVSGELIALKMEDLRRQLRESFTKEDMEYIKILENAYGNKLRDLKMKRDYERQGFTNATLDYYYPIHRADIAKSVDVSAFAELDRVSNASFNKNTVQGARGKLMIEDADALFHSHATAVTRYAALSPAIDNFNVLFNMDISGNPNDSVSVATVGKNQWKEAKEYFRDLIGDIQGKPKSAGAFDTPLAKLRSGYAMYQLGANPKTMATQFSSLFASTSILDADSIMKGMRHVNDEVDKYCRLAELRHYEGAAIKAQSVMDNISHVGEVLMKGIGLTDRLVVKTLWGACQVQVQKDSKLKIGTEENKVAAGKLLEKVLFETQQNSLATERSSAMRSGSEFAKAITMFSADGMKMTGRVVDGFGEVNVLREKVKTATGEAKDELMKQLKEAKKRCREAVAAMIGAAAFGLAVAELFRWLYAKERDKDENAALDLAGEFIGNMMGGLPLFRDAYSRLVDGYEMDNYTVSMMNDLLNSVDSAIELSGKIFKGESNGTDVASWGKQTAYVLGQFTGIPVRNIYNVLTGLTRRVSPRAGYQIDRVFYSKNYRNDLKAAVEDGDVRMAAMLTGIIHGKDASGEIGDEGMAELNRLAMAGANVLPRTIGKKITVDGEEIELTKEQRTAITTAYEDGWSVGISELMNSPTYANMTDEQREDAIRKVHNISYERALLDSGFDRSERSVILTSAVGLSKAAVYYATVSGMEADVDRKGNKIEGSKRAKTVAAIEAMTDVREERLLLLTAAGYSLQAGDFRFATAEDAKRRLLRYIVNMKGVSAEEKADIAQMCGFEVKNGKISAKSLIA